MYLRRQLRGLRRRLGLDHLWVICIEHPVNMPTGNRTSALQQGRHQLLRRQQQSRNRIRTWRGRQATMPLLGLEWKVR
jgi:hypothetical protein